jgi:DNA-binding transcriptional regulator LsrR (DeoR family)
MVDLFSADQPRNVELVPLIGGLSTVVSLVSGEELVRELAGKLGATYRYLHAPGVLRSKSARDSLLAEPAIAEVLQRAGTADIAMVGIGAVGTGSSSAVLDGLGLSAAERKAFFAAGPVGDTCCRFFDREGGPILGAVHDRVLAIELDQLRQIPTVMAVATGTEKAPAVLGAMHGELIDGLITDASLALALLSKQGKK